MTSDVFVVEPKASPDLPDEMPFPKSWTANSLSQDDYLISLPSAAWAELQVIANALDEDIEVADILRLSPEDHELAACRALMTEVKQVLDEGPGLAVVDRIAIDAVGRRRATALYWLLGSLLGRPVSQNYDGLRLYDVRDSGETHGNGVRGSVTNVELYYHTDNSYGLMPPQYIGLLCLQTAKEGGDSRLISWAEVYKRLRERDPELAMRGYQGVLFDRQKEHGSDDPMVISKPPFRRVGTGIGVSYSSRLMRTGYKMAGQEIDPDTLRFLDTVDEIIYDDEMQVRLMFERGQMQFINNARVGHARGGFTDHDDPELRRHLVRLWFREYGGTSYDG